MVSRVRSVFDAIWFPVSIALVIVVDTCNSKNHGNYVSDSHHNLQLHSFREEKVAVESNVPAVEQFLSTILDCDDGCAWSSLSSSY